MKSEFAVSWDQLAKTVWHFLLLGRLRTRDADGPESSAGALELYTRSVDVPGRIFIPGPSPALLASRCTGASISCTAAEADPEADPP